MALSWDIGNIKKYAGRVEAAYQKHESASGADNGWRLIPEVEGLIFWLGVIGFTSITEANAAEVYGRSKVAETMFDIFYLTQWDNDADERMNIPLTMEVVREHIGLMTNHGNKSLTEWVNTLNKPWVRATKEMPKTVVRAMVTVEAWNFQNAMSVEVVPA